MNINYILGTIIAICAVLFFASIFGPDFPPPDSWLLAWTSWVGSVVGIVVAAKVFWAGGEVAREYVLKMKRERGEG
jgi:hypothetical protein